MSTPNGLSNHPPLHPNTVQRVSAIRLGISLDWWAVIVAVLLAVLVVSGVLPKVPWDKPAPSAAAAGGANK